MANEKRLIDANAIPYIEYTDVLADDYAFRSNIDAMPTVDAVEVVHGRWHTWSEKFPKTVLIGVESLGVFCSVCEMHADNKTNYCPNCGAKMDGKDNVPRTDGDGNG